MVLSKGKNDTKIQFIDASGIDFYKKETNNNVLEKEHIDTIVQLFACKEDKDYISKSVDKDEIAEADYNLSVSTYVEQEDKREKIDIVKLNAEIEEIVMRENELREAIRNIIEEIEVG